MLLKYDFGNISLYQVNVTNSNNNENSNRNLDSSNNFISIMTRGSNSKGTE